MGTFFGACNIYVTSETKSNEITKYEPPTPIKSAQANPQRLSNFQLRNLTFIINDPHVAVNSLCSAALYQKLLNGESLQQLLDPLNDFNNNKLKEIATKVIVITSKLFTSNSTAFLLKNYKENILVICDTIEKKEFLNEKNDTIKKDLLELLANLTEVYQFFKREITKTKEPYDTFFWGTIKDIKNTNEYILSKINAVNKQLTTMSQILN